MSFNKSESARWAIEADKVAGELYAGVDKELAGSAARGFPSPPGDSLAAILSIGQGAKEKLVEFNGAKIYEDRRATLFQQEEFALNILVKLGKLGLELYQAQIFDALAIEEEQVKALRETSRADVERLNAETELRQRAIIQNRAEMERRIIIYKQQLVEAETTTLTAEAILIQATLSTAEKKLEIIASIYEVLAAEQLVLAAERRRAASLTKVLVAELIVAGIKKEMVPFYIQKAEAREELAAAIIAEIPITEALIRLGYDRIDLKTTEEYAGHLEREQQEELELLREQFVRANTAMELTRLQNHSRLLQARNSAQANIIALHRTFKQGEVTLRLSERLARATMNVANESTVIAHEVTDLTSELASLLVNMAARAQDQAETVKESASQVEISASTTTTQNVVRRILAG